MRRIPATFRRAALAAALVVGVLGWSCSVPDYDFAPQPDAGTDTGAPLGPAGPVTCEEDAECEGLVSTLVCDGTTGYCVECEPAREAVLDLCAPGLFCGADGRCAVGCSGDEDCPGLRCDVERRLCIGCAASADCAAGTTCVEAVCTPGCAADAPCPGGWECCDGLCENPLTSANACGGCGVLCDAEAECTNGACGSRRCTAPQAECDGDPGTSCETDTSSDPKNCGKCRITCASGLCSGGVCTTMGCAEGTADCNQSESDRCETDLFSVNDCRVCGKACSDTNGTPSCTDGGCAIACDEGFGDCDADADTGCETALLEDDEHCGACDVECGNEHGSTRCVAGECVPRCAQGYADCNGDPVDGCEADIGSSTASCGACGARCRPDNATGTCDDGSCTAKCDDGWADCNGDVADGCEADLGSPETCGGCAVRCSDAGGTAVCEAGKCSIRCLPGFEDCTGGEVDGCETNVAASPSNCGACGHVCPSSVGTAVCNAGVCGISTCSYPYEECVAGDDVSCETDLRETDEYCGDCGTNCTTLFPNATGACRGGTCVQSACDGGFADCNGLPADGCEATLGSVTSCRSCAERCEALHGTNACTSSGCRPACQNGFGDCDGNPDNGCETPLDTLFNCGGCGVACSRAHATESCATGSCEISECDRGFGDCNDESTPNGCETQLNSLANCGGCGVACDLAGGSESCGTGACVLTGCSAGRADCTGQAGCETVLGTTANCLGCGDACNAVNGTNVCTAGGCNPTCNPGYKSCDGNRGNGCETNVRPSAAPFDHCGDCGVGCDLPHATESCSTGSCVVTSCDAGWFDCSSSAPGCETQAGTTTNCGGCGAGCVNAHGTASCSGGSCSYACNGGFKACDQDASNGCETSTTTLSNCGACGSSCDIQGSGESCATGICVATACDMLAADCDANGSCETTLGNIAHCRSCAEVCTNANGTTSCNTSTGCTPACSAGYASCDGNPDNGCERSIRTTTDCGDCNAPCDFPNATESCASGVCTVTGCDVGYADCDGRPGCEPLGSSTSCASCGNACTNPHGTNVCAGSPGSYDCSPTCTTGWKSCDGNPDNGCERDLRTLTDCGDCGSGCSFAHGSESCATGTCTLTGCDPGWGDCVAGGDCETQLDTTAACGACNVSCTNANGTTACTAGACAPTCATGFKSCNQNPNDGCERSIRTVTDCGDCGVPCSFPHASASCSTGTCTMGSCEVDFGNCTASPGCETQLDTTSACGSCGAQCTNSHGTTTCSGSAGSRACSPTCSAGFASCDGNPNNGCEADLTTATHCGSCGNACGSGAPYCVKGACSATPASICSLAGWALCDDFQDGNANGWAPTGGTWSVTTDLTFVYRYTGDNSSQRSIVGTSSWTNQTVLSRVKVTHFDGATSSYRAGILGRYGGSTSYYTFQVDGAGALSLRRGTSTVSGSGSCATVVPATPLAVGTWYWLKLQISGGTNAARLVSSYGTNGTTFTPAQDCTITSGTLDGGSAGIITVGNGTTANFDEFAVSTP